MTKANESQEHEFQNLLDLACEGMLSSTELERFEEYLINDPSASSQYIETVALMVDLEWGEDSEFPLPMIQSEQHFDSSENPEPVEESSRPLSGLAYLSDFSQRIGDFISKPTPLSVALAFLVMVSLLATLALMSTNKKLPPTVNSNSEHQEIQIPFVAIVTDLHDYKSENPFEIRQYGEKLASGDIVYLKKGLMQVTFRSGASAILQGPARLRIESQNSAYMYSGKSTFYVPKTASGFTLETSSAKIVDIGTEFGVIVEKSGDTETHVLKGVVKARSLTTTNQKIDWDIISEQQAKRYTANSDQVANVAFTEEKFQRTIQNSIYTSQFFGNPPPNLLVDFNAHGFINSPTQSGYTQVLQTALTGKMLRTELGIGGSVTLTLENLRSDLARKEKRARDRDRGAIQSGPGLIKSNLLRDFIYSAETEYLAIRLSGLKSGEYSLLGYLHDSKKPRAQAKVKISVDGGKSFTDVATVSYSTTDSPSSIGQCQFNFSIESKQELVLRIQSGETGPHIINGFELKAIDSNDAIPQQ